MTSKSNKKTKLKKVTTRTFDRTMLLDLSLKYLRGQANKSETLDLFEQLRENLENRNQSLFDFLKIEIEKTDLDLGGYWRDFIGDFCSYDCALTNLQGQELESRLFLIPIVFGAHASSDGPDDFFEIVKLGQVRELMGRSGLISSDGENISLLTDLLSFEEVATFTETRKYQILQFLITGDERYSVLRRDRKPPVELLPHMLDIKFKFLVGCAHLRSNGNLSPLSILIGQNEEISDEQLELSMKPLSQFTNDLTEKLPKLLNAKKHVKVKIALVTSILEYSRAGLERALHDYNQFKLSLLLAKAQKLNVPRIKINQLEPLTFDLSLFEGEEIIESIQIIVVYESEQDMVQFLDEFFDQFESHGFYLESDSSELNSSNLNDELIFSKKSKRKTRKGDSSFLKLVH